MDVHTSFADPPVEQGALLTVVTVSPEPTVLWTDDPDVAEDYLRQGRRIVELTHEGVAIYYVEDVDPEP